MRNFLLSLFSVPKGSPFSLSHGFMTPKKRISATSVFFESMPYHLDRVVKHSSGVPVGLTDQLVSEHGYD